MSNDLLRVIDDEYELEYYKEKFTTKEILTICKGDIGEEFVDIEKKNADYIVIHYSNAGTENIRGFAFVNVLRNKETKYLYISLICNISDHKMVRRSEKTSKLGGRNIIEAVINIAKKNNITRIKLSAIDTVITYYKKLGFDLDSAPKVTDLKNMFKNLESKDSNVRNKALKKLYAYQSGYYKESNLAKSDPNEMINDVGIPMTLKLKSRTRSTTPSRASSARSSSARSSSARSSSNSKTSSTRKNVKRKRSSSTA